MHVTEAKSPVAFVVSWPVLNLQAYSCVAGVLTTAGSGYSSRKLEAAAGMDTWTQAYGGMAGQYT